MTASPRQMNLALLLGNGVHVAGWRMPEAEFGPDSFDLALRQTRIVEEAKFDMVFLADNLAAGMDAPPGILSRLEPLTLLTALAMKTSHIGLAATGSTTYSQPYNMARMFASLDHLSAGRAGWNIVTSSNRAAAGNFSMDRPEAETRYEMAAEFVDICKGLWDSWEDDAFILDKARGIPADMSKYHAVNYKGRYHQVAGPLNMARCPQGHPVMIQAGSSATGMAFAGKYAEVVFTVQGDLEVTKAFGRKVREMAAAAGRDPSTLKILPGICPIIAENEGQARKLLERLSELADPVAAMQMLTQRMDMPELATMPLDGPIPERDPSKMRGHAIAMTAVAKKYGFNLRQLRDYASASMGHRLILGSPEQVADDLEEWFVSGAADGFILHPIFVPGPVETFAKEVVPILQKRGLFRKEYEGRTLRDHLGLARPPHPAAVAAQ